MSKKKAKHNTSNTKEEKTASAKKIGSESSPLFNEEKTSIVLLAILILVVWVIRFKFLNIPFERDEGAYSYYGKLLTEGKIPYKDFFEIKFPGIFYFYGFIVSIFGDTVKGMHMGFMFLNMATIIIIYYTSRILFTPIAGIISAITFAFISLTPSLSGFTVQSEHGVAFFISLGILFYALSKKHEHWYYYLLMGISLGFSFLIKTNGVFLCMWGAVILILDFLFTSPNTLTLFAIHFLLYATGGISIILFLFLIITAKGAFGDMIFWAIELPSKYISNVTLEEGIKYFGYSKDAILANHKFFWYHSLLALIVCWLKPIDWKTKMFAITLLFFSFLTVVPGIYLYGHAFIQTIPGFTIVAG